ncbi:Na+/H+ antiporter NhaC [Pontibacillus litoralis]|uniref:Sodium:proton antiporter n=1 Tax=Pontibacillus litoralis JSM 072002 TaxID=1385512 RepID=A0A0A5G821_9BACI|nr:Na+/H+ antiporter NhaC [Pontibacillus litoralis]KGX88184.1 sodium:proton antiporter [Pontibacillus litoralis JSM 072002]
MHRQPRFIVALLPLISLVIVAALSIMVWNVSMFLPLMVGVIATCILGVTHGYTWDEMQQFMKDGVSRALPAVFILFIIGTIVGAWMLSGTIPTIIYYGLEFIKPSVFLPTVAITTGVVAISLGSSFTAIATVGLAFMAIGTGMGFPPAHTVGAIVSGAFFGDKISPLSDTTNVAPAMVGVKLFDHVRHMLWDTIPAFAISLILFWLLGRNVTADVTNTEKMNELADGLLQTFTIHPALLLLPIITILLILKRYPAIPSLVIVSTLGGIVAIIVQGNSVGDVMNAMTSGYQGNTDSETLNTLLSRGGITSMLNTIGLIIIATALGGVLEGTQVFTTLLEKLIAKIKSTGSLILTTVLSTLVVAYSSGEQFMSIILPSRALVDTYHEKGIDPKNLSRSVEAAGTVGINLVPWGVTAVFVSEVLQVSPYNFIPFIFFAYLVIAFNVFYGFTGFTITKLPNSK